MSDVTITNHWSPDGAFRWDSGAILSAVEQLGLRLPVRIRWTAGYRRIGCHRLRVDPRSGLAHHAITVSYITGPEQASRTLWHELAHAVQTEEYADRKTSSEGVAERRALRDFYAEYRRRRSHYERDAEQHSEFHDVLPLTRGGSR